jgi:hypothetical protein
MAHIVKGFSNAGGFTRLQYDRCAYQKDLYQSVEPLSFQMYPGKFENCSKCTYEDQFWRPFDTQIVDAESELRNITRRATKCPQYMYNPGCKKSCFCTSTYDKSNAIVMPQEVCSILNPNLAQIRGSGYTLNTDLDCKRVVRAPVQRQAQAPKKVVLVKR